MAQDVWSALEIWGAAELKRRWKLVPKPMAENGTPFYVAKMDISCDLQREISEEIISRADALALRCTQSEDIDDPASVARRLLDPLNHVRAEIVNAQQANADARGFQFDLSSAATKRNGSALKEYEIARERLRTNLEQQRKKLLKSEKLEEESKLDRAEEKAERKRRERIDTVLRIVQIGAAAVAFFDIKAAAAISVVVGIGALAFHHHRPGSGL